MSPSEIEEAQKALIEQYKMENNLRGTAFESFTSERFLVVPNPNNGLFKIYTNQYNSLENVNVFIYDMKGVLIKYFEKIEESIEVDLTPFGSGVYLVKMNSNQFDKYELRKIIVQ